MAEERTIKRLPVAAVDEDDNGSGAVAGKEIEPVAFARTVGDHRQTILMCLAIGFCVARPAGHDGGVFRNPRAIIVFDLVIHIRAQRITCPGYRAATPYAVRALADFCAD